MAFLANLIWVFSVFLNLLSLAIFLRALLSWFPISSENPFAVFLIQITDPILVPLRRVIPPMGMFDLTPMIAMFLLYMLSVFTQSLAFGM